MQGNLNSFQKSMLQWNAMHPYSAVHVARVRVPLIMERLRTSINSTLELCGLTRLALDYERSTYSYTGGPAELDLRIIAGDEEPQVAVVAEMERQLNLPFDARRPFTPFRFLVASAVDSFYLGLVYFHPAADAESVAWFLKDIVTAYVEEGSRDVARAPNLYPGQRAQLLYRHPMVVIRRLCSLPGQVRRLRESHRPRYADPDNMANGLVCFSLAPGDLSRLMAAAQSWQVTVNDLLIALLMKSVSPIAVARTQARKRRKISIGCIVNLRKDLGVNGRRTFGLFLGSFTVSHEAPDAITLQKLAMDVRDLTGPIKRRRLYLGTPLELAFARFMLKFFSPKRQRMFYAKHHPLWGGITNMNLNRLWEPDDADAPLDYLRAVSTGPVTPLVLSVTTIGDRLNLGLSYRTGAFSRADIERLQRRFEEQVGELP